MRTRFGTITASLTLLALAGGSLAAADMTVSDLRFGFGVLSRDYKGDSTTTVTDQGNSVTTTRSGSDDRDADRNWRGQVQYVGGKLGNGGGLIWGLGVAVNHASWDNGAEDSMITTPTVGVQLGYGYAFTPNWHFELAPFAGYGRAYYSITDNGTRHTSKDWDNYLEYGAKLGTYLALGSLVIGIEVPYLVGRIKPSDSYSDSSNRQVTVSDDRRNEGFGMLVTVGARF